MEQEKTLHYLGPAGTFTELAALLLKQRRGYTKHQLVAHSSITEVCQNVVEGRNTLGIVPLENSTAGHVNDTCQALSFLDLQIKGELILPIRQCLYWQKGVEINRISAVASKDSALEQCRRYLDVRFSAWERQPVSSTSLAVQMAAENSHLAAIAGSNAAEALGLADKLEKIEGIEDNPFNVTRFIIIQKKGSLRFPTKTPYKITLKTSLEDKAGSLFHYLDILAWKKVNLTEIKSLPRSQAGGGTSFLISLESKPSILETLAALRCLGQNTEDLGYYLRDPYSFSKNEQETDINQITEEVRRKLKNEIDLSKESLVVFTLADRIGALRDALKPFAQREINLTRIDSFPTGRLGEYAFYLTYGNHVENQEDLLTAIKTCCLQMMVLKSAV